TIVSALSTADQLCLSCSLSSLRSTYTHHCASNARHDGSVSHAHQCDVLNAGSSAAGTACRQLYRSDFNEKRVGVNQGVCKQG
ncbi:unnamed protein product, partial [Ectocarpus sp. 12 AP-2014]